ncbi:hypothetical protein ACTQ45_01855 [Fundicoccus sp. Sow4_D5]|uniref:hypothetical protein n=1 Tax=Fundicoccus sp. Sow4_D5 TaxID=3438782 RepID=UPI003F92C313
MNDKWIMNSDLEQIGIKHRKLSEEYLFYKAVADGNLGAIDKNLRANKFIEAVKTDPEWLLYFGLIALIIFAVFMGVTTNSFHWTHLIVRLITSITLVFVWNWLK